MLAILTAAEEQAQQRRLGGIHCADIMSRDVVSIAPDASLQDAWDKLAHHKIKALPVVNPAQALTGIVSLHDFSCRVMGKQPTCPAAPAGTAARWPTS
ncbi:CBS domain-containing protein [Aquitalea magnusonii]|uniref:CBS domain-containing protein n=1 Tax=Aquitalea magnusonii TaxID=332411 RepID=UPI001EFB672C|nr:CBS domain-containing protein [Aquitalea magnusonii]